MSVGYLFSGMLGHLPMLAVLIAGFVLIAARRERLGSRSILFARLGLGALVLGSLLQMGWTVLFPALYSSLNYSPSDYGVLFALIGLTTSVISAAGVGLLIAAVVSRGPAGGFGGPGPGGGPSFGGPAFGGGQGFGAGDRPAGPPSTG